MIHQAVSYKAHEASDRTSSLIKSIDSNRLVIIDGYDGTNHTLTLRDYHTGKPLRDPAPLKEKAPEPGFEKSNALTMKTLPTRNGPIVQADDHEASIRGSSTTGFYSSHDFGNIMKGPISFSALPNEMRVGGLMTFHPLLTSGFPSTIVTPIPTFQWSLPSATMLGPIAKDIALIGTLMGLV